MLGRKTMGVEILTKAVATLWRRRSALPGSRQQLRGGVQPLDKLGAVLGEVEFEGMGTSTGFGDLEKRRHEGFFEFGADATSIQTDVAGGGKVFKR